MNDVAMNSGVQVPAFNSFAGIPQSGFTGPYGCASLLSDICIYNLGLTKRLLNLFEPHWK